MSRLPSGGEIRLKSPAKINLGLRVLGLRPDGFHEVETWVQQITFFDRIRIRLAARAIRVTVDRPEIPSGRENLAYRAAAALRAAAGGGPLGASIHLEKRISAGAGLGGGSGNAAAVLWGLNRLWKLGMAPSALSGIAAGIGSDVPLFLAGPAALCRGRGERVSRRSPLASGWILVIKPPYSLPTPRVYGWMRNYLKKKKRPSRIKHRPMASPDYRNDLEQVVFERRPFLRECRDALLSAGAGRALMSGSGPALWGMFRSEAAARAAAREFARRRRWMVHLARPLTSSILSVKDLK